MSNKAGMAARTKGKRQRAAPAETPLLRELARAATLDEAIAALMSAAERERVARLAWTDEDGATAAHRGPDMDDVLLAAQLALGAEYAAHQYEDVRSKVESDLRSVVTYLADYKRIQTRIRRKALSLMDVLGSERPVLAAIARCYRSGRYGALAKYVPGA